jgi:ketosteroid isomerase-like protein
MNTDFLKVVLVVLALVGGLSAQCDKAKQERSEKALLEMENRWVTALDRRDPMAVDCLLAEDFVDSDATGQLRTRQQVLDAVPNRKTYAQHLEDLRARVYGDTGIVHGVNRISDKDGKEVARVRFTDVFRYRDGQWHAISGHETMVQTSEPKAASSE